MASEKLLLVVLGILVLSASFVLCDNEEESAYEDSEGGSDAGEETKTEDADSDGDGFEYDEGVMVLGSDNFDEAVKSKGIILVEFYAPWCGHCKALAPKYAAAAQTLINNDPPVYLAKVDTTIHEDLGSRFGISGYPTLKFFKNGDIDNPIDYEGPREEDGIVSYMEQRADPDWKPPPESAITLTKENFDDTVASRDLILVEFYAPWCGHCKRLAPDYEKAAKQLAENDPPVMLGKVDATVETELASRYDVTGYPTLKVFRKGKVFDYNGGRDTHGIVEYMRKQIGDASFLHTDSKELKRFLSIIDDVFVVGFFQDESDQLYETYMEAANALREDFDFAHTFDPAARDFYKVNAGSVVVFKSERYYTKYEPKWHVYDKADGSIPEIKEFLVNNQVPLVGQYNYHSKNKRYKGKSPLLLMFFTVDWSHDHIKATQMWRKKLAEVAKENTDITFAVADEEEQKDLFKQFGFDDSAEEINIGILNEKEQKFPMEAMEEFELDAVKEFVSNYKSGDLTPLIKSQPVPKKQKGNVKVVVGKSFNKIVKDKSKDVLIELYAPWCGHCKKLDPVYKELAKKYKKNKKLVIAKMDATANDAPADYSSSGYPTIYFAPANNKDNPIKHEGGRELEDLENFIKEHATVSAEGNKDEL